MELILFTALLGIGIAAAFLAVHSADVPQRRVPDYTDAQVAAIYTRAADLERERARCQQFLAIRVAVVRRLREGADLTRTTSRLHSAALAYHPRLLKYLAAALPGTSDRERLARYLVDHLDEGLTISARTADRVSQLRQEIDSAGFRQWCAQGASRN
jgi:hypothetical protein